MSFVTAFFYDRFMARVERACLREWRHEILGQVGGKVLEIGAGTGANIQLYSDKVSSLVVSEPDRHMRERLTQKVIACGSEKIEVIGGSAERIEADDESFDFVVTSLVCCSVTDLPASLLEIKRVLRPGGGLAFMEHVAAASGSRRRRWQNRINPFWKTLMGNCHLNRETERAIVAAGFEIMRIERESMRRAPPILRPTIRGMAKKPAERGLSEQHDQDPGPAHK